MNRAISVSYIYSKFLEKCPSYRNQMSFVEYEDDMCINVFDGDGDRFLYSWKDDTVLGVDPDIDYVSDIVEGIGDNEMKYREAFARLLEGRLIAMELTVKDAAEKCDISYSSMSKYLNLRRTPSGFAKHVLEKNLQNSQNDIWRLP